MVAELTAISRVIETMARVVDDGDGLDAHRDTFMSFFTKDDDDGLNQGTSSVYLAGDDNKGEKLGNQYFTQKSFIDEEC